MTTPESYAEEIRAACAEVADFVGVITDSMIAEAASLTSDVDQAIELIGEWVDDAIFDSEAASYEASLLGDDDRLESYGPDYWRNDAGEWRLG